MSKAESEQLRFHGARGIRLMSKRKVDVILEKLFVYCDIQSNYYRISQVNKTPSVVPSYIITSSSPANSHR